MNSADFEVPSQVMARQVGQETVILDLASGTYFGLNEIGAKIWTAITQKRPMEEVFDGLLAEFDVSREVLGADVQNLIGTLLERGLLRRKG